MFSTVATIALIISVVFGGGGATVAAAQKSQPDQPLYTVKMWSEQVQQKFTAEAGPEFQLQSKLLGRRGDEIVRMVQAGEVPPDSAQYRYEYQVTQTLKAGLALEGEACTQALLQIRSQLQNQLQTFQEVQSQASMEGVAFLQRTRQMVENQLQLVEGGMEDPEQLRQQLQQRLQTGTGTPGSDPNGTGNASGGGNPWTDGTPTPGSGYGPGTGDCLTCTPDGKGTGGETDTGQGGNPWTTETPTPGSGYGPGDCLTCTPVGTGEGPGTGTGGTIGGNPWTTSTPTPESGYGPGPGPTSPATCTPNAGTNQPYQPTPQQYGQTTQTATPSGPQPNQQ